MLNIYNTLSRKVEKFIPQKDKKVSMYSCGPTVYDYAHIGNLRAYVVSDILKRTLLFDGYEVKQVMNITDVGHLTSDNDVGEDKIEKSARRQAKSAQEIADFYTKAFKNDFKELNIIFPNIWAKASEHIDDQVELIKKLQEKGFVYQISDGLYFDTAKFENYGKLARLNLKGQDEGARVEINPEKKNPTDFAVWKFSPKDRQRQMEWDSPWGKGFPGWHLECSAMSMKYLGQTLDIHTGGIDHIPVHHTNEIAQSEAATGKKFVNYWVHNEFLVFKESKMAKSEGNFITLETLKEKGFDPFVYRFFCLGAHYRSKLNFSWEAMDNAKSSWKKLQNKFLDLGRQNGRVDSKFLEQFKLIINDDLNTPQALALMWEVLGSDLNDFDKRATLLEFDKVFGFDLDKLKMSEPELPAEIKKMVKEREQARLYKDWGKSDQLRDKLKEKGWLVEDAPDTTKVKKIK
ncbi:MAG TPA: cysteine--tRNA ligase [Patescibacteria group bacterium]|nr:cysteine--tRNA ligase [Patescibacteria group bacterium]